MNLFKAVPAIAVFGSFHMAVFALPVVHVGFEPEQGFTNTHPISESNGWTGGGTVTVDGASQGSQSLHVTNEATLKYGSWPEGRAIAYVDFWMRSTADSSDDPPTVVDADGAKLAFLKEGDEGQVYAYDGTSAGEGRSVALKPSVALGDDNLPQAWLRVTLREDFVAKTYDVFLGGILAAADLKLDGASIASEPKSLSISCPSGGTFYLDELSLSTENPLFPDHDNDGLPDAFESANGMNPNANDRLAELDGGTVTNLQKFLSQSQNGGANMNQASLNTCIYVQSSTGSDSNTGQFCYPVGNSGPKATVHAAIASAHPGDTVVIMAGSYAEPGGVSLKGNDINVKILDYVKLH